MSEWKEYKIGDILKLEYGKGLKDYRSGNDGFDVFGTNGKIGTTDNFLFDQPSIIIGRKGAYREVHYAKTPFFVIDTAFYTKTLVDNLDTTFLYYWFKNVDINAMDSGSAIPSTSRDEVYELNISLPDPNEQIAVASILSSLDDKIDLLNRQNQTLEKMAETLFRQWFVEEEWEEGTISQIITIQNGYAFKSKDFKESGIEGVLKIKNISGGIINIGQTDFISTDVATSIQDRFKVISGDVLIAMTGAEIGKLGIIPKTTNSLWLNQRVGLLKEKFKGSRFLAYLQLKSEFGQDYIENTATGSAQPNISGFGIENCYFPKLTDNQIVSYSHQIGEMYDKIIFNLGQISTLASMRDNLLPKLMSGEVQVDYQEVQP